MPDSTHELKSMEEAICKMKAAEELGMDYTLRRWVDWVHTDGKPCWTLTLRGDPDE